MRSGACNWSFHEGLAPIAAFLAEAGFDGMESPAVTEEEYSLGIAQDALTRTSRRRILLLRFWRQEIASF